MNHRERLKLLLRSPLFYLGALMLVTGIILYCIYDPNPPPIAAAILGQGGIIVCLWAYWRTRFIITDPASQTLLKRRARMGVIMGMGMVCVCFMLSPIVAWLTIPKMPEFIVWYSITTGLVGLLGLVGLFVWLKKSSN